MTHRKAQAILVVAATCLSAASVILASSRPSLAEQSSVTVTFSAESPKHAAATEEYRSIWSTDGVRIVATMERVSGLRFTEATINATVFEGRSFSGLPSTPMKLRASYPLDTKRSALIHELGHRLNFQLAVWPKDLDNHRVLYLFLYDVWSALYGQRFADEQVAVESGRTPPILLRWAGYNYRAAWRWALAKTPEARAGLFGNIVRAQSGQTATQRVDRSKPPAVESSAGGFTIRRLSAPIAVDGRGWVAVPAIMSPEAVRAPNGQFTLTLEEASSDDTVRFRIRFAEGLGAPVQLDPGAAVYASITSDSRWIIIDPIDMIDVGAWRRYNLSKLFSIDRYVSVRAISADGRRLFISRQPCPFDCQGLPNDYFEIGFPPG